MTQEELKTQLEIDVAPRRPDYLPYTTDPDKLADDPSGECYNSFLYRIRYTLTPTDVKRIMDAYQMSKHGHRGQSRKGGDRYFNHVRAVTIILIDECGITDPETLCAALLHDIVEDRRMLDGDNIAKLFGLPVMSWVTYLTKSDEPEIKKIYYKLLLSTNDWQPLAIKCADRIHNLRTLHHMKKVKIPEQIAETETEFPILLKRLYSLLPDDKERLVSYFDSEMKRVIQLQKAFAGLS